MTASQRQYLIDNGLDPTQYDVTPDGQIVSTAEEKVGKLPAFMTGFGKSVLPSAAALAAGAETGALGGSWLGPWGAAGGAILGGLGAALATGKAQDVALDAINPEINKYAARAQADQPVFSYLGGFAPNVLALKPDVAGARALLNPVMGMKGTQAFGRAAANVGANVAGSTAGQLLDVAQGGEFSPTRFAADVALGSLFNNPTKLGQRLGLHVDPVTPTPERFDLGEVQLPLVTEKVVKDLRAEGSDPNAKPAVEPEPEGKNVLFTSVSDPKAYEKFWRSGTQTDVQLLSDIAKREGVKLTKDQLAILAEDPGAQQIMAGDYSRWPEWIAAKADEALDMAHQRAQENPSGRSWSASDLLPAEEIPFAQKLKEARDNVQLPEPARPDATLDDPVLAGAMARARELSAENAKIRARQEAETQKAAQRQLEEQEAAQAARRNTVTQDDLLAEQMAKARELAEQRRPALEAAAIRRGEGDLRMQELERYKQQVAEEARLKGAEAADPELAAAQAKKEKKLTERQELIRLLKMNADASNLESLQSELDSIRAVRKQRDGGEDQPMTQETLNRLQDFAAKRGIKVELKPLEDSRGVIVTEGDNVTITLDPLKATVRTLTEELSHDVFGRTASGRVQKGLVEAAQDSGRYAAEVEALKQERAARQNKLTDEQIHQIALEEGFMEVFTKAHPEIPPKEILSWWQAFKGGVKAMAGMKMAPHEAMAWMNWAIHEGAPWSDVKAKAPSSEAEVRHSRDPLAAPLDKLDSMGGPHQEIGRGYKGAYNTRDFKEGQWRSYEKPLLKLSPEQQERLIQHLYKEQDSGATAQPSADLKEAYDAIRKDIAQIAQDAIAAGHHIPGPNGYRQRGQDPSYFPAHRPSAEIREIFSRPERAGERAQRQTDYLNYVSAEYLKKNPGKTQDQANAYAADKLEREIGIMQGRPQDIDASFAGASKPEGVPLPPSWRSMDIMDVLNNYVKRSATDYAYKQHIESSPVIMALGGHKTYKNGAPIPQNILQQYGGMRMLNEPLVSSVVREFNGVPNADQGKLLAAASRAVSTTALGPLSKATDTLSTLFKGLSYMPAAEWAPAVLSFAEKLSNFTATAERSYASGLNRRDAAAQLKAITGTADLVAGKIDKFAEMLQKVQLLPQIEQFSRVLAQAWGEVNVATAKRRAAAGDVESARFLDTLSPDWRTRSDLDLAAQVGRLMQGTYDMRSVPAWMLQGGAAPFLIWSKWSAGQYNNFKNYAVAPLLRGNAGPLIGQLLIGLAGGAAVGQVREWLNGREDRDINWNELASWAEQNGTNVDFVEALTGKLVNTMQALGTFGFAGDLVKASLEPLNGGQLELPAHMPFGNFSMDLTKRLSAAMKALDEGEDAGEVLKAVAKDVARSNLQLARVADNWIDEDASLEANDKRRQKFFDVLSGAAGGGNTFAVSYSNVSDKAFDKAEPADAAEIAGHIIEEAAAGATSHDDFKDRIRKLKTRQLGIMPNPDRDPVKAARYLQWLEGAEPGSGADAQGRFEQRRAETKYKQAMVDQMALGL